MNRYALFVDAGYLYAAGGLLCYGTKTRSDLDMDFQLAVDDLRAICHGVCGLPPLRAYWYDAAPDGHPTASHITVSSVEGVQLRLGRLIKTQKGVDSRIVRDLIVLSHAREALK